MGHQGGAGSDGDDLDRGLGEVVAGYVPLDRDLALEGGRLASRVGADAEGRLVLVLDARDGVSSAGDELVLGVLDALAWARQHRALLVRHLAAPALDPNAEPRVVLVCDDVTPAIARRLAALSSERVLLLERRELASAHGTSSWFVPFADVPTAPEAAAEARPASGFLERLDEERQRRADLLLRRLRRLDEGLACAGEERGLRWSFHGTELCALGEDSRGLVGRVTGLDEPLLLGADDALETFLDAALAQYLRLSRELEEPRDEPVAAPGGGRGG